MQSLPPPYLLSDFPRMAAHLKVLERAVGGVGCALYLHPEGEEYRMSEALLKTVREAERVYDISPGATAVAEAEAALAKAGF